MPATTPSPRGSWTSVTTTVAPGWFVWNPNLTVTGSTYEFWFEGKDSAGKTLTRQQGTFIVVDGVPNILVMKNGKREAILVNRNPVKPQHLRIAER